MVGSPSANRRQAGLEHMFGNFINMLPLRARLTGNPAFRDFAKAVRSTLLTAMDHSDIPFPKLVEALDIPQTPSYTPVFQALVSLADEPLTMATNGATEGFKLHALPTMVCASLEACMLDTHRSIAACHEATAQLSLLDSCGCKQLQQCSSRWQFL